MMDDVRTDEVRTYRVVPASWMVMAVCAAAIAALAGAGVYACVAEGPDPSVVAMTIGFAAGALYSGWVAAEMAWLRIEVGYDWIRRRSLRGSRRIAFSEVVAFSELRGLLRLGVHVSEFRLFTAEGPPLAFTSQVEGWAAIVQALHESIPWRVPPPGRLAARRAANAGVFDPISAAISAPGQPIPEERARAGRVRWGDALLAQLLALAISIFAAVAVIDALNSRLGRREWVGMLVTVVAVVATQVLALLIVRAIRAIRMRGARRRARRRLEDANALETQPPPRVHPGGRR